MVINKAEGSPSIGVVEKFFIYFIVVAVSTVILVRASGSIETSSAEHGVADSLICKSVIELLLIDDFAEIETINLGRMDLDDLAEFTDPNWISDAEKLYYPIIIKNSKRYDVDPLLVKAVIMAESGFNPNAVSHVGAEGLMQLMPKTARYLGVEDSFNPEHNIQGGVKYIKRLLDRFNGDVQLALAAYNAGSQNVRKYKGIPPYPETKKYIKKVSHLHSSYKKVASVSGKEIPVSQI